MTTKEKIIKSALALFVKRGIDNTPTALITKDAGFSEATLFVHFKNKQGLIDAVYLNCKARQKAAFSAIEFTQENAQKSLTNLYTAGVQYFVVHFKEAQFLNQMVSTQHISKKAKKELDDVSEIFKETFKVWKKRNEIKDIGFEFYDTLIWSALFDMTVYCQNEKLQKIPKRLESILWDMLKR